MFWEKGNKICFLVCFCFISENLFLLYQTTKILHIGNTDNGLKTFERRISLDIGLNLVNLRLHFVASGQIEIKVLFMSVDLYNSVGGISDITYMSISNYEAKGYTFKRSNQFS